MLAVASDFITTQVLAALVSRALGYPRSPQGWDGTALNQVEAPIDSVWLDYRGSSRQADFIYYLSTSDTWFPLSDATLAACNASTLITPSQKAQINALAAARVDIGANPYAGGRTPQVPFIGSCIYWIGDSITQAVDTVDERQGGMRGVLKTFCIANGYRVDMLGTQRTGSDLKDNENSGVGGNTCAQMNARVPSELGGYAGGVRGWNFPVLACVMAGANDVRSGSTSTANYATLLETLHTYLTANQPSARIAVTTITAQGDFDVAPFNATLPARWDTFDAAHPGNKLIRWDANLALGGPTFVPSYFYDQVHPNHAGYLQMVNDPRPGVGMAVSLQSYLAQIGAWP